MKKIVIAMSGGIDSSVAAILLKNAGYQCVGIHLHFWNDPTAPHAKKISLLENKCCSTKSMIAARRVCEMLNIPFSVINVERKFKKHIVDYFVEEYLAGRTPNPCVECNRHIKFGELLKIARSLGADYIATGHYAKNTSRSLKAAKDKQKDQSYFLYTLTQKQLRRVLFPLGNFTKAQVKSIAQKYKLHDLIAKKESQNLCFFPDKSYTDFLKRYLNAAKFKPGPIKNLKGEIIGRHEGIPLYTIGQRKNLGINGRCAPLFITRIDKKSNTIYVGGEQDLYSKKITVKKINFISGKPVSGRNIKVKIRYASPAAAAKLTIKNPSTAEIIFKHPQRAAAKGQSAVFYAGSQVIGGGIIS